MKFEKDFRRENPETIGELDHEFDLLNYSEWLENKIEKFQAVLSTKPPNKKVATGACKQNPKTCQFYDGIGCAGLPTYCTGRPR